MYIFVVIANDMKASATLLFILFIVTSHAQNANTNINNYKYVLVPEKFDFLKFEDQYSLNTTAKQLLQKKGFIAFVTSESLPPELAANKCLALKAEVTERNGLFVTRLTLLLKDCYGNIIYKGKEGKSSEKEFPVAYDGALRDAFASLNNVAYKYDSTMSTVATQPQQIALPQQTSQPQQTTAPPQVAVTPAAPPPTPSSAPPPAPASTKPAAADITGTLYAQPTPNGYQLVDTTPKKILTLLKTSVQDYFIADAGGSNGIVFKRNGEWFFERYEDNKLVSQKLNIKF
jgi:hypothetical protein